MRHQSESEVRASEGGTQHRPRRKVRPYGQLRELVSGSSLLPLAGPAQRAGGAAAETARAVTSSVLSQAGAALGLSYMGS